MLPSWLYKSMHNNGSVCCMVYLKTVSAMLAHSSPMSYNHIPTSRLLSVDCLILNLQLASLHLIYKSVLWKQAPCFWMWVQVHIHKLAAMFLFAILIDHSCDQIIYMFTYTNIFIYVLPYLLKIYYEIYIFRPVSSHWIRDQREFFLWRK